VCVEAEPLSLNGFLALGERNSAKYFRCCPTDDDRQQDSSESDAVERLCNGPQGREKQLRHSRPFAENYSTNLITVAQDGDRLVKRAEILLFNEWFPLDLNRLFDETISRGRSLINPGSEESTTLLIIRRMSIPRA